jgi:hypothetical protein
MNAMIVMYEIVGPTGAILFRHDELRRVKLFRQNAERVFNTTLPIQIISTGRMASQSTPQA